MSNTVLLVLTTILLLFLFLLLMFYLRQRKTVRLEDNVLIVKYPFSTQRVDLDNELESWEVQKAYYLRWGEFYSINMRFKQGKRMAVGSLFNRENYHLLYHLLDSRFPHKKVSG